MLARFTRILARPGRRAFSSAKTVKVTYVNMDGERATVDATVGDTLLQTARKNKIDMYGPCEGGGQDANDYGEGPCCTECRCFIPIEYHSKVAPVNKEEAFVLAQATDTNETSRLACQVVLTEECDGLVCAMPHYDREPYWNHVENV
eukprot:CAMPEP_0114524082 /NCGR_PEP_ID=MMETSP0109-20121206/21654_1 /TAXON_ID=29199 /ORGANISM="Chlorarachnion reptans, Strain CCCM449" /LENGTH=146 /DNA_ID=CAMNT_0001705479 /DNA_START=41 /DNA_END=481 /DNA_ORIENTATION=+